MSQKTRSIIGWVLTGLLAIIFLGSASMKFIGSESTMKNIAALGLTAGTVKIIGVLEVICLVLFIIPRTGIVGTLLLAAYMGGAIATHLEHQLPIFLVVIIECIIWITAIVRFPELGRRLMGVQFFNG